MCRENDKVSKSLPSSIQSIVTHLCIFPFRVTNYPYSLVVACNKGCAGRLFLLWRIGGGQLPASEGGSVTANTLANTVMGVIVLTTSQKTDSMPTGYSACITSASSCTVPSGTVPEDVLSLVPAR